MGTDEATREIGAIDAGRSAPAERRPGPRVGEGVSLRWPDRARWRAWGRFLLVFHLTFFPVYFAAGAVAAWSGRATTLHLAIEPAIPLVPWMIWPYLSVVTLFTLPLVMLDPTAIGALSRRITVAILVAGVVFVAVPLRSGFAPVAVDGIEALAFRLLGAVDTPHNLAPSLHVALGALVALACACVVSTGWRIGLALWMALLSASTVLVHQHHLVDVASGLALAVAIDRVMRRPAGAGGR